MRTYLEGFVGVGVGCAGGVEARHWGSKVLGDLGGKEAGGLKGFGFKAGQWRQIDAKTRRRWIGSRGVDAGEEVCASALHGLIPRRV
jgi:hypothetical protein